MAHTAAKILTLVALGTSAIAGCFQEPQHAHEPTAADHDAWRDVPVAQLESQPRFAELHREVEPQPDGSQTWRMTSCTKPSDDCCVHQFIVRDARIALYDTRGPCVVGCGMWPKAKVFDCLDRVRGEGGP